MTMQELITQSYPAEKVLLLSLNRLEKRNALNNATLRHLFELLQQAEQNPDVGVVVITGHASCFAAGADLAELADLDVVNLQLDERPQLWQKIDSFSKPLIAAVNGYALGAGFELVLHADIVLCGEKENPYLKDNKMMDYQHILVKEHNEVGYLTLNRPKQLNSFNVAMHQEVAEVLKNWTVNPDIRCVVISGAGRGFCAGQDLSDRVVDPAAAAPDLGISIEKFYNPLIKALVNMPKPVICAVNGVAAGAGANIALACDLVIAAKSASFIQAFCRLGLVPDSGGTWFLPRAVGHVRAMGLALLGDKLSAEDAKNSA